MKLIRGTMEWKREVTLSTLDDDHAGDHHKRGKDVHGHDVSELFWQA